MTGVPTSITAHFAALPDPRVERTKEHRLLDILTIALCAVICGADDLVGMATFAEAKERLAADVPAAAGRHPLPRHLRAGLRRAGPGGVPGLLPGLGAGGGAGHRRAGGGDRRQDAARVARPRARAGGRCTWSAPGRARAGWCSGRSRWTRSPTRSPPSPRCCELLDLAGAHRDHRRDGLPDRHRRRRSSAQGADYVLALKDNHPTLHEEVRAHLRRGAPGRRSPCAPARHPRLPARPSRRTTGGWRSASTGPSTTRRSSPTSTPPGAWARLRAIGLVERERRVGDRVTRRAPLLPAQRAAPAAGLRRRRPQPLGDRESGPLGPRRRLPRGRLPRPRRARRPQPRRRPPPRPQPAAPGRLAHGQHRHQTLPRRPRRRLPRPPSWPAMAPHPHLPAIKMQSPCRALLCALDTPPLDHSCCAVSRSRGSATV